MKDEKKVKKAKDAEEVAMAMAGLKEVYVSLSRWFKPGISARVKRVCRRRVFTMNADRLERLRSSGLAF